MVKDTYYQTGENFERPHTGGEIGRGFQKGIKASWRKANYVYIFMAILLIYWISAFQTFNWDLFTNILYSSVTVGIVALGMGLIILTGEIDLSVGSIFGFIGGIAILTYNDALAKMGSGTAMFVTLFVAMGIGLVAGFINGFFIGKLKMPSFIVTLATMLIFRSLIQYILSILPAKPSTFRLAGYGTSGDPFFTMGNMKFGGVSLVAILFIVLTILLWFVIQKTTFGRKVYAVGSNPKAASLVGINTGWMKTFVFALAGCLIGISAFLQLGIRGNVDPATTGKSYELYAIAAVVLGGLSMSGGKGSLIGIIFGTLAFQTIDKIIAALQLNANLNDTIKGVILIIAVVMQVFKVSKSDVRHLFEKWGLLYCPNRDLLLDARMKDKIGVLEKSYDKKVHAANTQKKPEADIIHDINALLDERDAKINAVKKFYEGKIDDARLDMERHEDAIQKKEAIQKIRLQMENQKLYDKYVLNGGTGRILTDEEAKNILVKEQALLHELSREILTIQKDFTVEKKQAQHVHERDRDDAAYSQATSAITAKESVIAVKERTLAASFEKEKAALQAKFTAKEENHKPIFVPHKRFAFPSFRNVKKATSTPVAPSCKVVQSPVVSQEDERLQKILESRSSHFNR